MNLKNKKYYIFLIVALVLVVLSIWLIKSREDNGGYRKPDKESNYDSNDLEKPEVDKSVNPEGDEIIIWTVPNYCVIDDEFVNKFNNCLEEDGYPFSLSFRIIDTKNYKDTIEGILSSGGTDIAFVGAYEDNSKVQSIIREGYFEKLDDYLASEEGKSLYTAFDKSLWKGLEVDGKVYTIPNSIAIDRGISVSFNKEYIPEGVAKGFDGDFSKLETYLNEDILNKNDMIPIIVSIYKFDFSSMLGYENRFGVFFDCKTGAVVNPYDTEEMYAFFKEMNKLYKNGYLYKDVSLINSDNVNIMRQDISNVNYGILVTLSEVDETTFDRLTIYNMPFYIVSRIAGSTGISKDSKNKEAALQLLTLLHTDEKYANLLIFGEEGVDYQLIDGFVHDMNKTMLRGFTTELALGIFDTVHPSKGDYFGVDKKQGKQNIYQSEARHDSVLLGFQINSDNFTDEMYKVEDISESYLDIWKEDNFEELYQEAREVVGNASRDLIIELERQIEQWRELYSEK